MEETFKSGILPIKAIKVEGLKIFTPKQNLQKLPMALAQVKAGSIPENFTAQKMKFFIKDFFSKYDKIRSLLRIWSHLLKKSFIVNFIFCAVFTK